MNSANAKMRLVLKIFPFIFKQKHSKTNSLLKKRGEKKGDSVKLSLFFVFDILKQFLTF